MAAAEPVPVVVPAGLVVAGLAAAAGRVRVAEVRAVAAPAQVVGVVEWVQAAAREAARSATRAARLPRQQSRRSGQPDPRRQE